MLTIVFKRSILTIYNDIISVLTFWNLILTLTDNFGPAII